MQVAFYLAGEITQVKESMPWDRCASGNVLTMASLGLYSVKVILTDIYMLECLLDKVEENKTAS